jgi:hypothetical protein
MPLTYAITVVPGTIKPVSSVSIVPISIAPAVLAVIVNVVPEIDPVPKNP